MNFIYFSGKIVNPQYILYIEECIGLGEFYNQFGIKMHLTNHILYEWHTDIDERNKVMDRLYTLLNQ